MAELDAELLLHLLLLYLALSWYSTLREFITQLEFTNFKGTPN